MQESILNTNYNETDFFQTIPTVPALVTSSRAVTVGVSRIDGCVMGITTVVMARMKLRLSTVVCICLTFGYHGNHVNNKDEMDIPLEIHMD